MIVKKLERQGFDVTRTGSGHWKVVNPQGGDPVIMAFSPRSPADYQTVKLLKRIGYKG